MKVPIARTPDTRRARLVTRVIRRFVPKVPELHNLSLRFVDGGTERAFQERYFRDSLPYIRLAHVLGIIVWAVFGVLADHVIQGSAAPDLVLRWGIAIPIVLVSLALTYAPWFPRVWRPMLSAVLLVNGLIWSTHRVVVPEARPDWAYAGLMVVLAFNYVVSRVPTAYATAVGILMVAYHNVVMIWLTHEVREDIIFADYFLLVFTVIGMAAAYGLERSTRLLFLRERELDRERHVTDELLRNTLPNAIVNRLKSHGALPADEFVADGHPQVTVLFADLVGFTERASRIPPNDLVAVLDRMFTRFDQIADRIGMEKIKTVGDAYMAVAGAPEPRADHAYAAAEMALAILDELGTLRWPTGEPMQVRIGIATGPAVAGVIGRRRFAYDLWGDTVNLASRLESGGEPGRILVSEPTHMLLDGHYRFSEPCVVTLKGKGPVKARFLLGRNDDASARAADRRLAETP
jgi:class 3 adenylate cyclase